MQDIIESRIAELKKKPFAELSLLPGHQGERIREGEKTLSVSVWKDSVSAKQLRIVVQVYSHWFLGIGRMEARGFMIDTSGNISMLGGEDLYEFI